MPKSRRAMLLVPLSLLALALSGCPQPPPAKSRAVHDYPRPAAGSIPAAPVSPPPVWRPIAGKTVILDAGHGGKDAGAVHFGLNEKDITLDLANRVAASLRAKGVAVLMTRTEDVFVPLADRSAFANRHPDAVLVSIHVNSAESNPDAGGVETFVLSSEFADAERGRIAAGKFRMNGSNSVRSKQALANLAIHSRRRGPALAASLQRSLTGRLGETDRGVKQGNLAVLRETFFCPAVLVEVGFLTNRRAADAMRTEDWRRRCGDGIADGMIEFLRLPE